MADIDLNDLLQSKKAEQENGAALPAAPEAEAAQVAHEIETLTPQQRQQVDEIKDNIDFRQTAAVMQYGNAAQKQIADFSDNILNSVRTKDSGYVGDILQELVGNVKKFDEAENKGFLKKIPLVGSLVNKAENVKMRYDKLSVQVERIQGELDKAKMNMMKDIIMFDSLYQKNLDYFKQLQLYIQAGEEKLTEMQAETLPKLQQQAAASNDPMAAQVVQDFQSSVERFEKKVHDLKLSKTIAIQTAPQIRLIQNNDKILADRVQSAIYNTIPLWKNQMVIALGLASQQKVLKLQQAVNNTTNELLQRNAAMLKQNSIATAKENERGIVDIATVKKVNEDLISTIDETLKIQQDGHMKRQAAEQELVQIEDKLKQTLLNHMDHRP
jgi:uncharacterized protein YaaN involved in tellurite resistance